VPELARLTLRREKQFFRRERDVVSLIDLAKAIRQSFVKLTQVRLRSRSAHRHEHDVAEMIEHTRIAVHRDRNQPFPTGERFAFVGESSAIAQRARVTLVGPALARGFAPELEIDWA
jgi:hypothetical protein